MNDVYHNSNRDGATLVEILMSLMVMSIGLVSVASLFPMSMLRSMQATQLTGSALLGFQCEDYLRAFPELTRNHYDPASSTMIPNWEYRPGVGVRPRRIGTDAYQNALQNHVPLHFVTVIDPLGAHQLQQNGGTGAQISYFGHDSFNIMGVDHNSFRIERKNGGFDLTQPNQVDLAYSLFSSDDSWVTSITSNVNTINSSTELVLSSDVATNEILSFQQALAGGARGRAVVFDRTGRQSHVSGLSNIDPGSRTIELQRPLPVGGLYSGISPEVRLVLFEPRYTCLVTLRRRVDGLGPDGQPGDFGGGDFSQVGMPGTDDEVRFQGGKLVIFFRRNFSPQAEQVYAVTGLNQGSDTPITISWGGNADAKPRLRNGAWVFDPINGYWYQIATVVTMGNAQAQVRLNQAPVGTSDYLMVPDNVINVIDFREMPIQGP